MKSGHSFILSTVLVFVSTGLVNGGPVHKWSDKELLDKSSLVVVGTPTGTAEKEEHTKLGRQPVVGVETTFDVTEVVKGDPATKTVIVHHYEAEGQENDGPGPTFVRFDPDEKATFRLFLARQPDGRFAPTAGQMDSGISLRRITK